MFISTTSQLPQSRPPRYHCPVLTWVPLHASLNYYLWYVEITSRLLPGQPMWPVCHTNTEEMGSCGIATSMLLSARLPTNRMSSPLRESGRTLSFAPELQSQATNVGRIGILDSDPLSCQLPFSADKLSNLGWGFKVQYKHEAP